mmetsp:Transcript_15585/g.37128  ORF Transcript_15585/g.37128 Transcript_15585/m.37128 type:complete len:242 (-) Transcript_15585:1446-2171(-)
MGGDGEEARLLQVDVDLGGESVQDFEASRAEIREPQVRVHGVLDTHGSAQLASLGAKLHLVQLDLETVLPKEGVQVVEGDDARGCGHALEFADINEGLGIVREDKVPVRVQILQLVRHASLVGMCFAIKLTDDRALPPAISVVPPAARGHQHAPRKICGISSCSPGWTDDVRRFMVEEGTRHTIWIRPLICRCVFGDSEPGVPVTLPVQQSPEEPVLLRVVNHRKISALSLAVFLSGEPII